MLRFEKPEFSRHLKPCLVKSVLFLMLLCDAFFHQLSSKRSPALKILKKGYTCRCQQVTTVREPFSSQFPCSQRVRSMKNVSFAMLRVEKPEFSRHLKPCLGKSVFCFDAAVWCILPPRLPPSLDMSCFLPSACPVRQQFANKCNDTVSLWLLLFYNFLDSWLVFSNSCNE